MKAHLALFSVNLIYALSLWHYPKKSWNGYIPAFTVYSIQSIRCYGILFWLFFFKTEKIQPRDYIKIAMAAAFGSCSSIKLMYYTKGWLTPLAINASIIMVSTPILVLIIRHYIITRTRIPQQKDTWESLIGLNWSGISHTLLRTGL